MMHNDIYISKRKITFEPVNCVIKDGFVVFAR